MTTVPDAGHADAGHADAEHSDAAGGTMLQVVDLKRGY